MSYQALARKWRPRTFTQLVGQEHVSKGLINSLNQQRIHHAYLFTGTRGVGKTSIARLLAKALNCEKGISAEPCLSCDSCIAIEQGRFIDLIEVDAASKTGVEDTRALLDNVQYASTSSRFKIYLIDEVHMLSQHSFNALLKTLEEPPEHVKFLLATTDPHKLPATVLSRCLQFHLQHLAAEQINKHLHHILNEENIGFEEEAINIIAQAAKGSMRDSLSILDQAIASSEESITAMDVKALLGYTQQNYAPLILESLAKCEVKNLLDLSNKIAKEGSHFSYVIDELLQQLHQTALYQSIGDSEEYPFSSQTKELGNCLSPEDVQLYYQIALKGGEEMRLAPTLSIGFDMTLLRMLSFRPAAPAKVPAMAWAQEQKTSSADKAIKTDESKSLQPLSETEQSKHQTPDESASKQKTDANKHQTSETNQETLSKEETNSAPLDNTNPLQKRETEWVHILDNLNLKGLALNACENAELIAHETGQINLSVDKGHLSLFTDTAVQRIEESLSDYFQEKTKINLHSDKPVSQTPAQQKQQEKENQQKKAEKALDEDPVFQQIQSDFSANVDKKSISPRKDDL